jgi:hypothetical protein
MDTWKHIERVNAHREQFPADQSLVQHCASHALHLKLDVGTSIHLRVSQSACQTTANSVGEMDCHGNI